MVECPSCFLLNLPISHGLSACLPNPYLLFTRQDDTVCLTFYICFSCPPKPDGVNAMGETKRQRTSYTRYQTLELEKEFHFNRYLTEREGLKLQTPCF